VLVGCTTAAPPRRAFHDPRLPNPETQKVAVDLVTITAICLKYNKPIRPGKVVLVGVLSNPGAPIDVYDAESTPGNERAISCAIEQGPRIKTPASPEAKYVRFLLPIPGRAEDVEIDFPEVRPARRSR
jgi:hypothetical protein